MATNFPQTLGQYSDPYAAMIAAQEARLAQPQAPAYTPEQQAQRIAQNQREYELGMLGQLSGDEALSGAGGHVLRQALAARSPRVTEKGVADPLRGTFTYSPDYLREQDEAKLGRYQQASAGARSQYEQARAAAAERADLARQRAQDQRELRALMASNRAEPLVAVVGPDGNPVLVPRSQAQGMRPAATGGGQPSEDERKAGGWLQQASLAFANMEQASKKAPTAAKPTLGERALSMVPMVGDDLAFANMPDERQQFVSAASSFSEAVLRAATGAGVNEAEARQKVLELTPRFGEREASLADKRARTEMYLRSLELRAGRALPAIQAAGVLPNAVNTAAGNDPLGLRSPTSGPR